MFYRQKQVLLQDCSRSIHLGPLARLHLPKPLLTAVINIRPGAKLFKPAPDIAQPSVHTHSSMSQLERQERECSYLGGRSHGYRLSSYAVNTRRPSAGLPQGCSAHPEVTGNTELYCLTREISQRRAWLSYEVLHLDSYLTFSQFYITLRLTKWQLQECCRVRS